MSDVKRQVWMESSGYSGTFEVVVANVYVDIHVSGKTLSFWKNGGKKNWKGVIDSGEWMQVHSNDTLYRIYFWFIIDLFICIISSQSAQTACQTVSRQYDGSVPRLWWEARGFAPVQAEHTLFVKKCGTYCKATMSVILTKLDVHVWPERSLIHPLCGFNEMHLTFCNTNLTQVSNSHSGWFHPRDDYKHAYSGVNYSERELMHISIEHTHRWETFAALACSRLISLISLRTCITCFLDMKSAHSSQKLWGSSVLCFYF